MNDWKDVINPGDPYTADDFRNVALQLLSHQILYEQAKGHVFAYRLIMRYLGPFKEVFSLVGLSLVADAEYRFIAAVPDATKQSPMSREEARLLLVLRKAYHTHAIEGSLDEGRAVLTIEEFRELYRSETELELPANTGELRDFLARMKALGVLSLPEADEASGQPFDIAVLPGITALVSEGSLWRLNDYRTNPFPQGEASPNNAGIEGDAE
jgi:hypothetical protein